MFSSTTSSLCSLILSLSVVLSPSSIDCFPVCAGNFIPPFSVLLTLLTIPTLPVLPTTLFSTSCHSTLFPQLCCFLLCDVTRRRVHRMSYLSLGVSSILSTQPGKFHLSLSLSRERERICLRPASSEKRSRIHDKKGEVEQEDSRR